ncbi:MAG: hypothetical protein FWD68_07685 [Alphaproteobacteria bacterium]|nr:hypothetical protein [Alphaproteobacteria bacterium]
MKRVLIGIAILVGVGTGIIGVRSYAQLAATAEVDALFERIRATGAKASHGAVAFDAASRSLTIEDIAIEPPAQADRPIQASLHIARIRAAGVSTFTQDNIAADSIDASGVDVAVDAAQESFTIKGSYKVPQITLQNYSSALRFPDFPAGKSPLAVYRYAIEQFTTVTASSVSVPDISFSFSMRTTAPAKASAAGPSTVSMSGSGSASGVVYQNISKGRIAQLKGGRASGAIEMEDSTTGKPIKESVEMANMEANDIDLTAGLALLDPKAASDDSFHQIYGHTTAGPYSVTLTADEVGFPIRAAVSRITIDGVALQPSSARHILALLTLDPNAPPSPEQAREVLARMADAYQGFRVGRIELTGMSMDTTVGGGKLNAIRYDENELAIEGLDVPSPDGPGRIAMERFAIKAFRPGKMMQVVSELAKSGKPSADQMLGFLQGLTGFEFRGITMPYKKTGKIVTLGAFGANWGQYVGTIPTRLDLTIKGNVPADPSDPMQVPFIAAGVSQISFDSTLNMAWNENTKSFNVTLDNLTDRISATKAHVTLGNVSRAVFSTDIEQAMTEARQIETGTIEFDLRDTGLIDLIAAMLQQNGGDVSKEDARQQVVEAVKTIGATATTPDAAAVTDALVHMVQTPGQTFALKLTPRGKVPALGLVDLVKTDPVSALNMFQVEASTRK